MECPSCKEELTDVTLTYETYVEATASEGPDGRLNLVMRNENRGEDIIRVTCAKCEEVIWHEDEDDKPFEIGEIS